MSFQQWINSVISEIYKTFSKCSAVAGYRLRPVEAGQNILLMILNLVWQNTLLISQAASGLEKAGKKAGELSSAAEKKVSSAVSGAQSFVEGGVASLSDKLSSVLGEDTPVCHFR